MQPQVAGAKIQAPAAASGSRAVACWLAWRRCQDYSIHASNPQPSCPAKPSFPAAEEGPAVPAGGLSGCSEFPCARSGRSSSIARRNLLPLAATGWVRSWCIPRGLTSQSAAAPRRTFHSHGVSPAVCACHPVPRTRRAGRLPPVSRSIVWPAPGQERNRRTRHRSRQLAANTRSSYRPGLQIGGCSAPSRARLLAPRKADRRIFLHSSWQKLELYSISLNQLHSPRNLLSTDAQTELQSNLDPQPTPLASHFQSERLPQQKFLER